jgi:hypothetical protein
MATINLATDIRLGTQDPGSVHAASHRVWPLPLPYLDGNVGVLTSPGTPDLLIDGSFQLTWRLRAEYDVNTVDRFLGGIWSSVWFAGPRIGGFIVGVVRGDNATRQDFMIMNAGTQIAAMPRGKDAYVRATVLATGPVATKSRAIGYTSPDGQTWNQVASNDLLATMPTSRVPTGDLQVGWHGNADQRFFGRIYWAEMEKVARAQLIFPGVTGNYLTVPHASNLNIPGDIEIVSRVSMTNWATGIQQAVISKNASYAFAANVSANLIGIFFFSDAPGTSVFAISPSHGLTNGVMYWLKMTRSVATGVVSFYKANDQPSEPTTWTLIGTNVPAGSIGKVIAASNTVVDIAQRYGAAMMLGGRVARVIVRNGIGGPTVLDLSENDAGSLSGTTFLASTGQTVTVSQTAGNTIVQPQPNSLMWRFDAKDYPGTGTSFTDPRGRTWTMSTPNSILRPSSQPD